MKTVTELEQQLLAAFPPKRVEGSVASHNCEECDALRKQLGAATWIEVPAEFIEANDAVLPLLTHDAYLAFLPAWLRQSVRNPSGPAAGMIQVNLRHKPNTQGFTRAQAAAIIEVAKFISSHNAYGSAAQVNVESLEEITRIWNGVAV